jgi:dTDP-glucose 4,6-dehydratase
MQTPQHNVLVTGGAGFIGSAVCRRLLHTGCYRVIVVDKLTYAGNLASLESLTGDPNLRFERCDIADKSTISRLLAEENVDCVMHLAAETHVDRSIHTPDAFIETNILGTFRLLEAVRAYWQGLDERARADFRFHHVSTDEVFGDIAYDDAAFTSELRYRPSSPYSASKAASDHLVAAWHRTYDLPVVISHSSNTYGPYQFPDKLIPLTIVNALEEQRLPVYGAGANMRDWIYVDDHARALELVLTRGRVGEAYSVATRSVRSNLDVVRSICRLLDTVRPRRSGAPYDELTTFVADRLGHDRRYAGDARGADTELGWAPQETFESGLAKTIHWYLDRQDWWGPLRRASEAAASKPPLSLKSTKCHE